MSWHYAAVFVQLFRALIIQYTARAFTVTLVRTLNDTTPILFYDNAQHYIANKVLLYNLIQTKTSQIINFINILFQYLELQYTTFLIYERFLQ